MLPSMASVRAPSICRLEKPGHPRKKKGHKVWRPRVWKLQAFTPAVPADARWQGLAGQYEPISDSRKRRLNKRLGK